MNLFVKTFKKVFGAKNFSETQAGQIIRACFDTADDKKFEKFCLKNWKIIKVHVNYAVIIQETLFCESPKKYYLAGGRVPSKRFKPFGYSGDNRFWFSVIFVNRKDHKKRHDAGIRFLAKERDIHSKQLEREMVFLRYIYKPSKEQKAYWIAMTDKPLNPDFSKTVCHKFNFIPCASYQIFKAIHPKAKVRAMSVYLFEIIGGETMRTKKSKGEAA
jgi:hypothetical protein